MALLRTPVSVTKAACAAWLTCLSKPNDDATRDAELCVLRDRVRETWSQREKYYAPNHGEFFVVPLTSSYWGVVQYDKRPQRAGQEGLVLKTIQRLATLEDKLQRGQYEHVREAL